MKPFDLISLVSILGIASCAMPARLDGIPDGGTAASSGGGTASAPGHVNGPDSGVGGAAAGGQAGTGSGGVGSAASACNPSTPEGACGLSPLCGCATGENCVVIDTTSGETACVVAGSIQEKNSCFGSGSCQAGMECIGGTCARYCAIDADCGSGSVCVDAVSGTTPVPGLRTCTAACALDNPNSCAPGIGCFYLDASITDCRPAGTSVTSCVSPQDCAPGYMCLTEGECVHWCRADAPACPGGTTCNTGTAPIVVQGVVYGVCL